MRLLCPAILLLLSCPGTKGAVEDVCGMEPLLEDAMWFGAGEQSHYVAAFMKDHVATSSSFLNSYPVVTMPARSLRSIYMETYRDLEKQGVNSIQLRAGFRAEYAAPNQTFLLFFPVNGKEMMFTLFIGKEGRLNMIDTQHISGLGEHVKSATRIEAGDKDTLVITSTTAGHQMLVRDPGQTTWSTYDYSDVDIYPTGLLEMKRDGNSVTYLIIFESVYAFYTIHSNPVKQAIRLEWGERHFDNKRLLSCPVHPCEDFRLDSAFFVHGSYLLMSGLHAYRMQEEAGTKQLRLQGTIDLLKVTGLQTKRVDAALTAVDSAGDLILFLIMNDKMAVRHIKSDLSDLMEQAPVADLDRTVISVFSGVHKVDAAVSVPRMKANLVWLFHGSQYSYFEFPGADVTDPSALPTLKAERSGSISQLLPGLYTPIDAAVLVPTSGGSSAPKARFFVDNWYYEGFLNGSRVEGPFLMQEKLFDCKDHNYTAGSFNVLRIETLRNFSDYMSQFLPVMRAESMNAQHEIILYALIGVSALIVLVSIGICIYMWRKSHKEKTHGFHAKKKKFKYDYD